MTNEILAALIKKKERPKFNIETYCFDKQISFIRDESHFKTAVCSRRAGKTVGCAADLIRTGIAGTGIALYITLSRSNAKKIIWPELLEINHQFKLGGKANESDLSLKFGPKSVIYLSGASDKSEIENFRGLAIKLCYIDEAQSFKPYLKELIDDVVSKALYDHDGTLCLLGTPGPVPAGYFWDCVQSKGWSHHAWTMFDNPWLERKSGKTAQQHIDADCERSGLSIEDPKIQRECFGRWVTDPNALVIRYNASKNHFQNTPVCTKPWNYVIGVDLGYDDADAIAVIGWNEESPKCYLVEEIVKTKQGITELAGLITNLAQRYDPLRIVVDTGGLGKKIAEELQRRFALPVIAAEKVRKFEFIELLNDALRTERFFAKQHGRFAQDAMVLEWDRDSINPKVLDSTHSDIIDAVLYAFRESLHWLHSPEPDKIIPHSDKWFQKEVEQMEEQALENYRNSQVLDDPWERA